MNTIQPLEPVQKVIIRPISEEDFPAFLALSTVMHKESEYRHLSFSEKRVHAFFRKHLTEPDFAGWVVEVNGSLVAGFLAQYNYISQFSDDRVAFENGFFVHPDYRRQGIAEQLFNMYEAWAQKKNCRYTYCSVTTEVEDKKTVARIEKMGYKPCGTLLKKAFFDECASFCR